MYTYEKALNDSIKYFNGNELSAKVFIDKYALRDHENNILENTPDMMHRRMAKEFARIEQGKFEKPYSEEYIYELFKYNAHIVPQGSPSFGIGNNYQIASISNCFVLESPKDSYGGICKTDEELVQLSKRRGGVGIDLSNLRPKGSLTLNSSRTSTGIKSWMNRYSNSIREVGQNGRRGALMLTLSVHHPDIIDFITAKNNDTDVTGANISTRLTNEFLTALENDEEYELRFPVDSDNVIRKIKAKEVWDLIIHNAWARGEPGVLFWDNIIEDSIPDCYIDYKSVSTNPCGEIILSAYDSCRLLVLNLMKFVNKPFTKNSVFNFVEFYNSVQIAQRLMDDLVDLELEKINSIIDKIEKDPESDIIKRNELSLWKNVKAACENGRRTGLGITALGDAIAACGIRYGTDESIEFVEKVYKVLKFSSYRASVNMAKELNPFPVWNWEKEKNNPFLNRIKEEDISLEEEFIFSDGENLYNDIAKYGRRNIANLTTAPVGTISTQCSYVVEEKRYFSTTSGIEPNYTDKPFTRRKKGNPGDDSFRSDFVDQSGDHWMEFDVFHTGIEAWKENNPEKDIKDSPYNNANADQIVWTQRVKLQAAAQKHVDHSISSTVNLPNDILEEEVAKIYNTAWKSGCKGITVYRDGCRTGVLVKKEEKTEKEIQQSLTNATKRPKVLPCDIYNISVSGNKYTVIVGLLNGQPYEVFCVANFIDKHKNGELVKVGKGKYVVKTIDGELELSDYLEDDTQNALLRMVSTSLRHGASIKFVTEQLQKTKGDLTSFTKCVARALKKYIQDGDNSSEKCECGNQLVYQEGCLICKSCGYSKCN